MKIQLLSDLHLESNPGFVPRHAPGADVLVLAGDIGSYQDRPDGRRFAEPDWGLRRFANWPVPVLYVPGNHEYDALDLDETRAALQAACERLGIVWLDEAAWTCGPVRFLGCTLWSDYDALAQGQPEARAKAFRAADHYLRQARTQRAGQLWLATDMREHALLQQAWLRAALRQPFEGATVVVTHYAPSLHSADPRYGLRAGTAGFCNALDALAEQADLWLHGHLHCPQDYRIGRCRVCANPLGYASKGEQLAFKPTDLIELPVPPVPIGPAAR